MHTKASPAVLRCPPPVLGFARGANRKAPPECTPAAPAAALTPPYQAGGVRKQVGGVVWEVVFG